MAHSSERSVSGHSHHHRSHHHRSHTRSMSPPRSDYDDDYDRRDRHRRRHGEDRHRHSRSPSRSRSPGDRHDSKRHHHHRHHHHHHRSRDDRSRSRERRRRHSRSDTSPATAVSLPYGARQLSKRDLPLLEPMFAMYLDIQKGLVLEELSEEEVKGRWKSFVKRWNRGELAEGWYDPSTFEKAKSGYQPYRASGSSTSRKRQSPDYETSHDDIRASRSRSYTESGMRSPAESERTREEEEQLGRRDDEGRKEEEEDGDEDEEYGPQLPGQIVSRSQPGQRPGPTIPTMQDLELRRESALEAELSAREEARKQRRAELQAHKVEMRAIEDEIAPRAEPGTRERRLEKRREAAAANREFAQSRRGGSPTEAVPDAELMGGGGEDDLQALKKAQELERRKKNEREIRREEMLRARAAEREQRLKKYREKEEETMSWLKALAKQRFG
ncbi:hypothetical protein VTN77DRAFT_159 [Rasamsonia byssochlamydoides]|uniref:uncharacterized protein n=1 Tax=Rasamsonia byssochlamydoides TaxID=89139 RepID=UPI003742D82D